MALIEKLLISVSICVGCFVLVGCGRTQGFASGLHENADVPELTLIDSLRQSNASQTLFRNQKLVADVEPKLEPIRRKIPRIPRSKEKYRTRLALTSIIDTLARENPDFITFSQVLLLDCDKGVGSYTFYRSFFICDRTLKALDTRSGLAFVVAHEWAHVILSHASPLAYAYELHRSRASNLFGRRSPNYVLVTSPFTVKSDLPSLLRSHELEADLLAIDLMLNAGFNVNYFSEPFFKGVISSESGKRSIDIRHRDLGIPKARKFVIELPYQVFRILWGQQSESPYPLANFRRKFIGRYVEEHYGNHRKPPVKRLPWAQ